MAKKQKKAKQQFTIKRIPGYALFIGFLVVVFVLRYMVGSSMQDMENSAFRDEKNEAVMPRTVSENIKQTIAYAFDPEAIIAQQIERTLSYRSPTEVVPLLRNIQDNLQYNRNKAAVLFYLAYAQGELRNTPNAIALYERIRDTYEDRHLVLYIFNAPRNAGTKRAFSVSLVAETQLRQALLLKDEKALHELMKSSATYGEEAGEGLLYRDIAAYNVKHLDAPVSSAEMYLRTQGKE